MKDLIVHSSLQPILNLERDIDNDRLSFKPSIGTIIQRGSRGYVITFYEPKISYIVHGVGLDFEETSTEDLDRRVRDSLLSMSKACKTLARDFLDHAKRLEAEAKKENLIDEEGQLDARVADKNHASFDRETAPSSLASPLDDGPDPFD